MAPETRSQDARRVDDFQEVTTQRINGIEVKLQAQSDDLSQLKTMMMELATQQIAIQQTLQTLLGEANSSQNREMKIWASASEEGWLLPKGSDSLNCIQTLELKSSAEPGAEEAFFNQVSSIRESRSDDMRFSIFTGTKRLHLRAEIREDRLGWMEALQAVKDMFPRMSNSELMAPMDNVAVSNELRKLLQEGVREEVIQESEQIMRREFVALQNQRVLLKQKQWLLTDTLRLENFQSKKKKKKKKLVVDRSNLGEAEEFSWWFPQFNLEDKVDFMDGALSRTGKGRAED